MFGDTFCLTFLHPYGLIMQTYTSPNKKIKDTTCKKSLGHFEVCCNN